MCPAVVKVKPDELQDLQEIILRNPHSLLVTTKGVHESFRIAFAGETIVGYTTGKIVSSGHHSEAIVQSSILSLTHSTTDYEVVIGSDEAGKGEWLGPLVIAAVALTPQQSLILKSRGVMDSKIIPVGKLGELSSEVASTNLAKKVVMIPPETFNKRFEELHQEGKGLNDLLAWGHSKAIHEVYQGLSSKSRIRVVIDEFARSKTEERLARLISLKAIELIQRPRAEDEIAVAAASIIAREEREKWIDWKSSKLGIDLRDLSVEDANKRNDKHTISKLQYLSKQAKKAK